MLAASSAPDSRSPVCPRLRRVARTKVQDGTPAPVTLTTTDVYCVDGQRLRLVSGTYGANNAQYRTEIDRAMRVTSFGLAGKQPTWFRIERSNGLVYEYGNTRRRTRQIQRVGGGRHLYLGTEQDRGSQRQLDLIPLRERPGHGAVPAGLHRLHRYGRRSARVSHRLRVPGAGSARSGRSQYVVIVRTCDARREAAAQPHRSSAPGCALSQVPVDLRHGSGADFAPGLYPGMHGFIGRLPRADCVHVAGIDAGLRRCHRVFGDGVVAGMADRLQWRWL